MKKLLSLLTAAIMCGSAMAMNVSAESDNYDFNLDGVVDYRDANVILEYYAAANVGNNPVFSEEILANIAANGDINGDDVINSWDSAELLTYIVENNVFGDVNVDGALNSLDASIILEAYSLLQVDQSIYHDKDYTDSYGNVRLLGDYNGDGVENALDCSAILADYAAAQIA